MKFIAVFILTLTFLPILEVKRKSDLRHDGLVGPVRTVLEFRFHETEETPKYKAGRFKEGRGSPYLTISYNEKGDRTEETYLYGPPKIVYCYNAEGNRIVNQWFDGRATNSGEPKYPVPGQPYQEEYKYDTLGRRTERLIREHPYQWRTVYSYGNSDRLEEERLYSLKDGSPIRRISYTYNAKGAVEREVWYSAKGSVDDEMTYSDYKYDSRGNWLVRKAARHQHYDKNMPEHQMWWTYREIIYY
ncbi:MAG TPA: hypothetical protein VGX48_08620 [Pyrinomonadaceae bacterium]|jgi:hypothetical protein|nr:hypothetical protein [Pyrinomonadaceae bacterium]